MKGHQKEAVSCESRSDLYIDPKKSTLEDIGTPLNALPKIVGFH